MFVILPGFLRPAAMLAPWKKALPGEVQILDLPGQGDAPPCDDPSVAGLVRHFAPLVPQGAFVIGESLGGLVALGLAALGHRVAAFDPPLSPHQAHVLVADVPVYIARRPQEPWIAETAAQVFGLMPGGAIEVRDHWPLIDALTSPVTVIAASTGSVLSAEDQTRLSAHPMVGFGVIDGPHTLLNKRGPACLAAVLDSFANA